MNLTLAVTASLSQDMCVKMAVGSNIENITDASTVHQPMSTFHAHDSEQCCGLPYQDHNYGARPPPPPTPPLSPDELNSRPCFKSLIKTNQEMCVASCPPTVSPPPSNPPILSCHNGLESLKEVPENNASLFFPLGSNLSSESILEDVTRCICGFTHDDGYMICCDRCSVWQHIDCMNIDRNDIPETYLCDKCNPRSVNQTAATELQAKKREDLAMASELETSEAESEDDNAATPSRITYISHQSTPTSLTIISKRTAKRAMSNVGPSKKRKRSREDFKKGVKRLHSMDKKPRARSVSKSSCTESLDGDHVSNGLSWETKLREWSESYLKADANKYTPELLQAVLSASSKLQEIHDDKSVLEKLHLQLAKVQQLRNRVMAIEDICIAKPVAELRGNYMLSNQFEGRNSAFYKRPYPYVFFYTGFDGLEICVDARTSGNITRYMRRSCSPNSELRHVLENNKLHLFVFSKQNIPNGTEITIPFDFKYQNCNYQIECGCSCTTSCPVNTASSQKTEIEKSPQQRGVEDDLDKKRLSPIVISRIHHDQTNGYISSDHEASRTNDEGEPDDNLVENHRKKSREERKMEAYIRAFEKLEKEEKRKEQYHMNHPTHKDDFTTSNVVKKTDASNTDPVDNCLSPSNVTPQRRTSRKRSTRGGRKGSIKRGRGTSFETVLSPDTVAETDSCDSVAPLSAVLEHTASVETDHDAPASVELPTENAAAQATSPSHSTELIDPPTVVNNNSNSSQTQLEYSAPSIKTDIDSCVSKQTVETEDCNAQVVTPETQIPATVKNQGSAENEEKPKPLRNCENAREECMPVVNSNSSGRKSKKGSSVDVPCSFVPSSGTKVSTPTTGASVDKAQSFVQWEYRPGVPSGHIHIGIGFVPERKRSRTEKFVKKRWLDQAVEEDLVPKTQPNALPTLESAVGTEPVKESLPLKKFLLKRCLQKNSSVLADDGLGAISLTSATAMDQTAPLASAFSETGVHCVDPESADGTLRSSYPSLTSHEFSPFTAEGRHRSNQELLPAIEYENLSDDELAVEDITTDNDQVPEPQEHKVSSGLMPEGRQYFEESFGDVSMPNSDPAAVTSITAQSDEAQATPAKKKVSLQEYMKRIKNGGSSTKPVPTATASTSSLSKPTPSASSSKLCQASQPVTQPTQTIQQSRIAARVSAAPAETTKILKDGSAVLEEFTKIITGVPAISASGNGTSELTTFSTTGIINNLRPELIDIVSKTVKQLTNTKEGPRTSPLAKEPAKKETRKLSENNQGSKSAAANKIGKQSPALRSPAPSSCSSDGPVTRNNHQPVTHRSRSGSAATESGVHKRSRLSVHVATASPTLSPATPKSIASPRSSRAHSASSIHSPVTPTIHDHRHSNRVDFAHPVREYATESGRSRHNSGASSASNSTISSKSPRTVSTDSVHQSVKYSGHTSSSTYNHKPEQYARDPPPQKVPSLVPAVPSQPLPSPMRTSSSSRAPSRVYSSRPPPSRQRSNSPPPPRWNHYDPPPGRPPREYSRYYHPADGPPDGGYRRSNRGDRSPYYNDSRYPPSFPPRRDDGRDVYPISAKHSSSSTSYYHDSYYPGPHADAKNPYYPPRDVRPHSPPPRSVPPDYYAKRKNESSYRSSYYPPELHRR